jgi:hypothetical protein
MEDRWGRRVYGKVQRGPKYTRFRIEIELANQCVFHETHIQANDQLDRYPKLYGWTLDLMTEKLIKRVAERLQ